MIPYCMKCRRDLKRVDWGWFCMQSGCPYYNQQIPMPLFRTEYGRIQGEYSFLGNPV